MNNDGYIEIYKTGDQFSVRHIGVNGESLGRPQLFDSKQACKINTLAYLRLFHGRYIKVKDTTASAGTMSYYLLADGTQSLLEPESDNPISENLSA